MLKGIVAQAIDRIPPVFSGLAARRRTWLALRLCLLALATVVLVRTAWISDDAYITLRTLDHFVHGQGLRYNAAERVQAFTHPLWLFVLAIPYALTQDAFHVPLLIGLALSLLLLALFLFRGNGSPGGIVVAFAGLFFSRAFIDYSTSGLENPLTHLFLLAFLLLLGDGKPSPRRLFQLGLLAGLATLNRMDSFLLFAPGLAYVLWRLDRRDLRRGILIAAAGFVPFVLWEIFSVFYYGFPYPNTAVAKLYSGIGGLPLAREGFFYLYNSLTHDPVTLVVIAAGAGAAAAWGSGKYRAVLAGIVLYLIYVIRIGGDFMSGRFLTGPLLAAAVVLMRTTPRPLFLRPVLLAAVAVLGFVTPFRSITSGSDFGCYTQDVMDQHGIADERRYYFGWNGWLSNYPGPERPIPASTRDGRQVRDDQAPLMVEGAIGVTGFYAGRAVHLVDNHGLTEPLLARLPAVQRDTNYDIFLRGMIGKSDSQGWRIGHFLRNVPHGYLATLLTGRNQIADPRLSRYYDHLALIIRGPLWSGRRLAEIVRMNFGAYDGLLDRTRPDYVPVDWGEAIQARPDVADFYYRRGLSAQRAQDFDGAEKDMLEATRLAPRLGAAWGVLGVVHKVRDDTGPMLEMWQRAIDCDPELTGVYLQIGNYYMGQEQFARALEYFQRGLATDPTGVSLFNNIGSALSMLSRDREAIPWLEKAVRYTPDNPSGFDNLGQAYMAVEDLKRARGALERSIALREDDQNRLHAGIVYADLGQPDRALEYLKRSLALNPANAETSFYLGAVLQATGRETEAIAYWRKSARSGFPLAQDALKEKGQTW